MGGLTCHQISFPFQIEDSDQSTGLWKARIREPLSAENRSENSKKLPSLIKETKALRIIHTLGREGKFMNKVPLFYHEKYGKYRFGRAHPFNPERFPGFAELVRENEVMNSSIEIKDATRAEDEDLEMVHTKEYIENVYEKEETGDVLTLDTPVLTEAPEAARMIVGGSLEAAKAAGDEGTALNMGGLHHAGRESGEGFCIFNDVAVAAQHLANQGKKVCIFDTDAHQGNGTMEIFYESSDVLFISIHQDPRTIYPGEGQIMELGKGEGKGYTVNIPLPKKSTVSEYQYAIEEIVKPIVEQFSPEVIIRNGGSDPHRSDALTELKLDMKGLKYLGETARNLAKEANAGHVDLMVSGYGKRVLEGWKAITIGSLDLDMELPSDKETGKFGGEPMSKLKESVEEVKEVQGKFWEI